MLSSDRPDEAVEDGGGTDEKPACVALVPVVPTVDWSRVPEQSRSRADFVTQLIATAQHLPQTRSLRRATPADAEAAYGAQRQQGDAAGIRTRQIV
jgi:hypothetical protein